MTVYNLHIPGVTTARALMLTTTSSQVAETKKRRQEVLKEIRRRRAENYKRFLAHNKPHKKMTKIYP